jgi:hypothetical protein
MIADNRLNLTRLGERGERRGNFLEEVPPDPLKNFQKHNEMNFLKVLWILKGSKPARLFPKKT